MVSPFPEGPLSQLKLMLSPWNCKEAIEGMLKPKTFAHCESTHSKTTVNHFSSFTPNTHPCLEFTTLFRQLHQNLEFQKHRELKCNGIHLKESLYA